MVVQHAGGVGRCAKARGMEPVYGVHRAVQVGKLSKSLCLSLQYGDEHFSGGRFPRDESSGAGPAARSRDEKKRQLHF